ncbi:MAG: ACT domain-containing protein [Planctomycetota bacterium]
MELSLHEPELAICRLSGSTARPTWARGSFVSVTRTPTELSIVCPAVALPTKRSPNMRVSVGWKRLSIDGELDLALVGVLAELLAPLARAQVSVFPIATFDTDHVLVQDADAAVAALEAAGHTVRQRPQPG